jgi:dihydropteroate synthase
MHWQISSGNLSLDEPRYLGILNVTPDSFSDGGRFQAPEAALVQAASLVATGADLLDLGAESTRPGARAVDSAEEWARLQPVLEGLAQNHPKVPLSLDSRHPAVALKGLGRGVAILNDVTGFSDPGMLDLVRGSRCGLIAMRSRQSDGRLLMPPYEDPAPRDAEAAWAELRDLRRHLLDAGIEPERILLDPGFGFGTTFREDLALWESLPRLTEAIDWPAERICIALSRKRFLARMAGSPDLPPDQRDALTAQAHAEARAHGFRVFRTHALPQPRVRMAEPADAPAIARIHVESWRAAYRGILPEAVLRSLSVAEKESMARELIQAPPDPAHRLLVLDRGGRLLGFAAVGRIPGEGLGEVFAIYLHPAAWGKGLGRLLLARARTTLREQIGRAHV